MATKFQFNITDLNYDSLVASCRALASSYFPNWEFDNPNDLARFTLDLFLHGLDRLMWLANRWAREFNLLTAIERQNVEGRARVLGYPVSGLVASTGNVNMTFTTLGTSRSVAANAITLSCDGEDGEKVYLQNKVGFTIPSNTTDVAQIFEEGQLVSQSETGTGKKFQEIVLNKAKVIDGTVKVVIDSVEWEEVDGLVVAGAEDTVYVVEPFGDTKTKIVFGDGVYGAMPPATMAMALSFRSGGGVRGNLLSTTSFSIDSTPYSFAIANHAAFTGGSERENIERIRLLAPLHRRAYDRLVTAYDVRGFVEGLAGVARAKVSVTSGVVYIYVVPVGGGVPSNDLLNSIDSAVSEKLVMGFTPFVAAPAYLPVTITVVGVAQDYLVATEVENSVETDILARLNPVAVDANGEYLNDFGRSLMLDDLIYVIRQNGAMKPGFTIVVPTSAIAVGDNQILTHVASTVSVSATGGTLLIEFTTQGISL